MKVSRIGGVIAAANPEAAFPMRAAGPVSAIKRIVLMLRQAGVFPIVIITGAQEEEVRYELSASGVVFLPAAEGGKNDLFSSLKTGLEFLRGKCDKVIFSPVNAPLFTPKTLESLVSAGGEAATPSYGGKSGHPVMISQGLIPELLESNKEGLDAFLNSIGSRREHVPVDDPGITCTVHEPERMEEYLASHRREMLHPTLRLGIEREEIIVGPRAKLLLLLIDHTRSVNRACGMMALSYSKAWDILNRLERELEYRLVERKHGGNRGGSTMLTAQGRAFLVAYQDMEERVLACAREVFTELLDNDDRADEMKM